MRELSIIDLTSGVHPIENEDERIHILVKGEFYDFERQHHEFERCGHLFRTRSDSEVALHLYEECGAHCVQQLRGEFAFALWDETNQTLFAARDRFGIKPHFYDLPRQRALSGLGNQSLVCCRSTCALGPREFLSDRYRSPDV